MLLIPPSIILRQQKTLESAYVSPESDPACDSNLQWPLPTPIDGARRQIQRKTEAQAVPLPADWGPKTLPAEIWQLIFGLILSMEIDAVFKETNDFLWGRNVFSTRSPSAVSFPIFPLSPFTISHVCGLWRNISFGTSELWSMIKIIAPQGSALTDQKAQRLGSLITLRLRRAHARPLTVSITARDDIALGRVLLRSLIPFRSQWSALYVDVPSQSLTEFATLGQGDVPVLMSIKFRHNTSISRRLHTESNAYLDGKTIHICNISSALRRLCISSLILPTSDTSFCSRLHEVNIQQSPSETWSTLRFLAACPQLRVLTLSGCGVTFGLPLPDYVGVSLPELETLNMEHPSGRHWLLRMLNLPRLKSIWLGGRCDEVSSVGIFQDITELLRRSGRESLECLSLELDMHRLDASTAVEFLKTNPAIRELVINDAWTFMNKPLVTSEFFTLLTLPQTTENELSSNSTCGVCPQLARVKFMNCYRFDDDVALVAFLRSRFHIPCKLREGQSNIHTVDISMKRSWQRTAVAVKPFFEQGLAITVTGV